jgi:hypothetical protein
MFHYFKNPYFTCTFFTEFIYNEYIRPYFFYRTLFLKISPVNSPRGCVQLIACSISSPASTCLCALHDLCCTTSGIPTFNSLQPPVLSAFAKWMIVEAGVTRKEPIMESHRRKCFPSPFSNDIATWLSQITRAGA